MNQPLVTRIKCVKCGAPLEECAFCNGPDCPAAICFGCLNVALGQEMPQPHVHGG